MYVAIIALEHCIVTNRNLIIYSNSTSILSGKYLSSEEKEERRIFVEKLEVDICYYKLAIKILNRENK